MRHKAVESLASTPQLTSLLGGFFANVALRLDSLGLVGLPCEIYLLSHGLLLFHVADYFQSPGKVVLRLRGLKLWGAGGGCGLGNERERWLRNLVWLTLSFASANQKIVFFCVHHVKQRVCLSLPLEFPRHFDAGFLFFNYLFDAELLVCLRVGFGIGDVVLVLFRVGVVLRF